MVIGIIDTNEQSRTTFISRQFQAGEATTRQVNRYIGKLKRCRLRPAGAGLRRAKEKLRRWNLSRAMPRSAFARGSGAI